MYHGSCLCGAVTYQVHAPIDSATHCHCTQCRKGHGAAFATYTNVRREHFRFTQGEESVAVFNSSPGVSRTFCRHCGTNLQWFAEHPYPNWLSIALGTLDTPLTNIAQKHIHTDSCAAWYRLSDSTSVEMRD